MKNNEFEKLDALMGKHTPPIKANAAPELVLSPESPWPWKSLAMICLLVVVSLGFWERERREAETLGAFYEVMSADLTEEEMPVEFETTLAFFE